MSKREQHGWWSDKKKVEVVTAYLILGKSSLVAATTGVPEGTVRVWKQQPWWKEMVISIQTESDQELDAKLAKNIERALSVVNDRLENGDFLYDPKTGEFIRKPVSLKDAWKVNSEMIDKRWLIRKQPQEVSSQEAVGDILKNLAKEFSDMAKQRLKAHKETPDASIQRTEQVEEGFNSQLQGGVSELPREAGTNSESLEPKPSA